MKILISKFVLEANANIPTYCDLDDVNIHFGQECITRMQVGDVFSKEDIEIIPGICADAGSSGVMKKAIFNYIEQKIVTAVKENIKDIDAIYLHLHGASEIEEIGSGDHHIVRQIRKVVGPYLPIAVVCDPHGNLSKEYVENTTIIRSYRESPHTDIVETIQFVCKTLIALLKNRQRILPVYRKLPMILGGEQSVSTDEPVKSINQYMNTIEKDHRILSCSWHVGYIRHDTDVAGCGIVVIPSSHCHQKYAEEMADKLASYVWDRRHEFHYTGLTANPDEALRMALDCNDKPVFITDSGDNVTSGSTGANTFVLNQFLDVNNTKGKRILFASITDDVTYNKLNQCNIKDEVNISLGKEYDALSSKVNITVIIKHKGRQRGTLIFGEQGDYGGCITVSIKNKPIDIIITDTNHPFVEHHQVLAAGVDWNDYDITVTKIGYAFPELKKHGKMCIMALTDGPTLQNTSALTFKRIMRPIFPIDDI